MDKKTDRRRSARAALLLALAVPAIAPALAPPPALAAAPRAAALSEADKADLRRVEQYLDGMRTLKADFEQFSDDGAVVRGTLLLSRPGRMRFDYAPPAQMSIVSDGSYVAVDDRELKQVTYYPVDATPVWFLLREGIKLSGDVTVTRVQRDPAAIRVTAVQARDAAQGSITLVFALRPMQLVKWIVVDQQGRSTTVSIENPAPVTSALAADTFRLPANPNAMPKRNR